MSEEETSELHCAVSAEVTFANRNLIGLAFTDAQAEQGEHEMDGLVVDAVPAGEEPADIA